MAISTPRQARSERTLKAILAACDRLLFERPFEQISMQDIAREAGVSVGNLYNRFSDKNGLVDHVLADHQARFLGSMETLFSEDHQDLDTRARLSVLVDQFARGIISLRPLFVTMAARLARGEYIDSEVKSRSADLVDISVDWLLRDDPDLDPERCRFAVASITSSLQFDLLFGTPSRLFGKSYHERLCEQAYFYLVHEDINTQPES